MFTVLTKVSINWRKARPVWSNSRSISIADRNTKPGSSLQQAEHLAHSKRRPSFQNGASISFLTVCIETRTAFRRSLNWREKDLNLRRHSQQIYSLPPLTTRESLHCASDRHRTRLSHLPESNRGPRDYKSRTLPTELRWR